MPTVANTRHWREVELWKDVSEEQWNDWMWQLTHTIRTLDDLKKVINLTPEEEEGVRISNQTIPLNITPYYALLMDPDDPRDPIRMQSVPVSSELVRTRYDMEDPLHEDEDSPVPGLTRNSVLVFQSSDGNTSSNGFPSTSSRVKPSNLAAT